MLVVLGIRRPVCSVNHLLGTPSSFGVCLCWLSRCREFVNSATLISHTHTHTHMCVCFFVMCVLRIECQSLYAVGNSYDELFDGGH